MRQTFKRPCTTVLAAVLLSAIIACGASAEDPGKAYGDQIDTWHKGRIERLTRADGYLSLVGLFPLENGTVRFGSDAGNDLVFPGDAPAHAGTIAVDGDRVMVTAAAAVEILHEGQAIKNKRLIPDTKDNYTKLVMGTFTFYLIDRGGRLYIRLKDSQSDALQNFNGVERYAVSDAYRVPARFERYDPPRTIRIPNVLGYDYVRQCTGALVFEMDGKEQRLEPMSTMGAEWFVVFGDETSARETYGGGRFVYVPAPDESGATWIDFNKAYNPPCAFSEFATCPLPHPDNIMKVFVRAGEKKVEDGH